MNELQKQTECSVSVENRKSIQLTGVTEVESFDDQSVVLSTGCGNLEIYGSELHVDKLEVERGFISVIGKIDSVEYTDIVPRHRKKIFGVSK